MRKYWYRKCLIITLVFSVFFYTGYSVKEKMERNEKEEVSAGTVSDNTVIPGRQSLPKNIKLRMPRNRLSGVRLHEISWAVKRERAQTAS